LNKISKEETQGITAKAQQIQKLFENILLKHEIDVDAFAHRLILSKPPMDDLLIRKKANQIDIGYNHYFLSEDGDIINDIVISFDYNAGRWITNEIENSKFENRSEDEELLTELFDIFKGQEWLERGVLKTRAQLDSNLNNRSW